MLRGAKRAAWSPSPNAQSRRIEGESWTICAGRTAVYAGIRRLVAEVNRRRPGHPRRRPRRLRARPTLPDVVLLDIDVPGGGLTVVSHIRSTPALEGITVIALTALAMQGDRERFLAAGCDAYISKPISVKTFVAEIEAVCRSCT